MIDRKTLLEPSFAANPPFNISAKILGLVMAILAGLSAFFGAIAVLGLFGVAALAFGGIFLLAVLGLAVSVVGAALSAWGGLQMYQGKVEGKVLAIYGLIISVVGNLIAAIGGSGGLVGWFVGALISFGIYYLIVISRYDSQTPVTRGPSA